MLNLGKEVKAFSSWSQLAEVMEQVVMLEEPELCGNVKRRRLAYVFERPRDAETKPEVSE